MRPGRGGFGENLTAYGDPEFSLFLRKVFLKSMGYTDDALGRPIIGITNTGSAYNSCHGNAPALIDAIKRGVALAGGLPFDFPVISLHESFAAPTSMYLRNLMAIDVEEMIRAQPMDAVVLVGGCDKTVPALLMGAASAGRPAILEVTGPMLTGSVRGERVGACTDCRRYWARFRAGDIDAAEIAAVNDELGPTVGTCMVMGTASTMALTAEALGMLLPGGATIPAVAAARLRHAEATGSRAVAMAREGGPRPDGIMTEAAFRNAFRTLHAIGGSTNGLIHLTAIARRLGIDIPLVEIDRMGRDTPMVVDLKPSGRFYMQDLDAAGGFAAIRRAIAPLLELDSPTVAGRSHRALMDAEAEPHHQEIVRPADDPIHPSGALAVLIGNLAPRGAVIKEAAADPRLLVHEGRAIVFDGLDDMAERIDSDDLDVTPDDILVLRGIGPRGAPGMPEAGYLPIPKKLARAGVKDMVRISDGRMSGTAYGTIILHVTPEAALGGPLAQLRTGDRIRLDVPARRLNVLDPKFYDRGPDFRTASDPPTRGYAALFDREVLQADQGCDFDFLSHSPGPDSLARRRDGGKRPHPTPHLRIVPFRQLMEKAGLTATPAGATLGTQLPGRDEIARFYPLHEAWTFAEPAPTPAIVLHRRSVEPLLDLGDFPGIRNDAVGSLALDKPGEVEVSLQRITDATVIASRQGFTVLVDNAIHPASPDYPMFDPSKLAIERRFPRILYTGDIYTSDNIAHFMTDALVRGYFARNFGDFSEDSLAFSAARLPYCNYFRERAFPAAQVLEWGRAYAVDELFIYPRMQNPAQRLYPPAVAFLSDLAPPGRATKPYRCLYVSRRDQSRRSLHNEARLEARLSHLGFESIIAGALTPEQQVNAFRDALVVVAPHGAALTNILFMQPGTHLIELRAPTGGNLMFAGLAKVKGLGYESIRGGPMSESSGSWRINVNKVIEAAAAAQGRDPDHVHDAIMAQRLPQTQG